MSVRSSLALFRVPSLAPAMLAILFSVLAEAVAGRLHGAGGGKDRHVAARTQQRFLTLSAISGIAVTTLFRTYA